MRMSDDERGGTRTAALEIAVRASQYREHPVSLRLFERSSFERAVECVQHVPRDARRFGVVELARGIGQLLARVNAVIKEIAGQQQHVDPCARVHPEQIVGGDALLRKAAELAKHARPEHRAGGTEMKEAR